MKKLLPIAAILVLTSCSTTPSTELHVEEPMPEEAAFAIEGSGGSTEHPYKILLEDPELTIEEIVNSDRWLTAEEMDIPTAYPYFNPFTLLKEEPDAFREKFRGWEGEESLSTEEVVAMQKRLVQLEEPLTGEAFIPGLNADFEETWPEPINFFTLLQKEFPVSELEYSAAGDESYAYYDRQDYPEDDHSCEGYYEESYSTFELNKDDFGQLISLRTQFNSHAVICGPAGGEWHTELDVLVEFDESGEMSNIFMKVPDTEKTIEGALMANYHFYGDEIQFVGVGFHANQMMYPHISYTYQFPFDLDSWHWN